MKTSEMKNNTSGSNTLHIDGKEIAPFNNSFNINTDSEKEPAKILSNVLNAEPILNQRRRQQFRDSAPSYSDYAVKEGENKDELDIKKINENLSKFCLNARELKDKATNKGTGIYLVPFKIANRSYCWTLLSRLSLQHQLQHAKGNKVKDNKS